MNERIEELADYAYSYASEQAVEFTPEFMGYYNKKFSELIVGECVEIGIKAWLADNSTVPTFPSKQIKEHFGFE